MVPFVLDIFFQFLYCVKNHWSCIIICPDFPSPVILKPESSGQSQTVPSPSHCLFLSWRGPSGKSSSPRQSKKKKKDEKKKPETQTQHHLTAQPRLSFANICWSFSKPRTAATSCHPPLRVSVASPQHLSSLSLFSSSSHLFAKATDSASQI